MSMFKSTIPVSPILITSGVCLSLLSYALGRPSDQQDIGPKLAEINNKLFNDMELVNKDELGLSRMPSFGSHGGNSTKILLPIQKSLLAYRKSVRAQGYKLQEALIVTTPELAKQVKQFPRSKVVWDYSIRCISINANENRPMLIRQVLPLEKGSENDKLVWDLYKNGNAKPYLSKQGDFTIYAAPIKFEHRECLSCHSDKKLGDTVALYVASYGKSTQTPPLQMKFPEFTANLVTGSDMQRLP